MMFRSMTAAAITLLAVTTVMAQGTPPQTLPGSGPIMSPSHGLAGRRGMSPLTGNSKVSGIPTLRQRMQDMESTLDQMNLVLKQMQAKAAKSSAKDSLAKANLEMWELLVGHLEKQLQELKLAAAREDVEARRASLYRQADAKAEAAAAAARAAQAAQGAGSSSVGQAPTPTPAAQGAGQSKAGQTPASQTPPPPPAPASPSPN